MCEFKQAFCAPEVEPISVSQVLEHVDDARKVRDAPSRDQRAVSEFVRRVNWYGV
jgi:hypothetical protein